MYVDWMMGNAIQHYKIFMEEFGVNVWTAQTKDKVLYTVY